MRRWWWLWLCVFPCVGFAMSESEQRHLTQLVHAMDALAPLIHAAKAAQTDARDYRFHYQPFVDSQGVTHPGLPQDLANIRQGIVDALARARLTPRAIAPIGGDYRRVDEERCRG